jgi:hypothetical protein
LLPFSSESFTFPSPAWKRNDSNIQNCNFAGSVSQPSSWFEPRTGHRLFRRPSCFTLRPHPSTSFPIHCSSIIRRAIWLRCWRLKITQNKSHYLFILSICAKTGQISKTYIYIRSWRFCVEFNYGTVNM